MKIRKYRSKTYGCYEYSITHLSDAEFEMLASVMANLRFDVPFSAKIGNFSVAYDGYTSIAPASCADAADSFRRLFSLYGQIRNLKLARQTEFNFDIDDVL